jgi:DeoR family transcriptional regulator, suf operon transcriptional repressor
MNTNQKKILEFLLDHPEGASLDEISDHLEISKSGAKEHIIKLEAQGLLSFEDLKGEVGRPRRNYLLSQAGNEVFPRQYSWLSNELLELLAEDLGEEALTKIMKQLANKVVGSMGAKFDKTKTSAELLNEITKTMNELGYRASLKQTDIRKGAVLEATNCVYHTVAKAHPVLCKFDIQFLEKASGLSVKLESCIARGGSVCRFCLKKP